ncbi:MAG: glycosyltransferase family 1 protein [Planctomycetes bacterium]|nr:glycosyltransferase family 1 protein [Planctomycetota bacterium]
MRVAFDVSVQATARPTGVARVQRSLLRELAAFAPDDEFLLVAPRRVASGSGFGVDLGVDLGFDLPLHFRRVELPAGRVPRLWRERLLAPWLARERVDLLHSPVAAFPLRARCPVVVTWHEVPWREGLRGDEAGGRQWARRAWLHLAARRAARIVAVSSRTRGRIAEASPRAAAKCVVVPHGVDARFLDHVSSRSRAELLQALRLPDRPYLLFVGAARARKNVGGLLDAFARLPAAARGGTQLLLAGVEGAPAEELRARAAALGIAEIVQFPGWIEDALLPDLYAHAELLVQPSWFEGFGLPAFEAMACGTPVVATHGTGEGAALLVPAGDVAALAQALERLLGDAELRATLRARGRARVATMRWRTAALQLHALWRDVVERRR